jgi:hypothetical protein
MGPMLTTTTTTSTTTSIPVTIPAPAPASVLTLPLLLLILHTVHLGVAGSGPGLARGCGTRGPGQPLPLGTDPPRGLRCDDWGGAGATAPATTVSNNPTVPGSTVPGTTNDGSRVATKVQRGHGRVEGGQGRAGLHHWGHGQ